MDKDTNGFFAWANELDKRISKDKKLFNFTFGLGKNQVKFKVEYDGYLKRIWIQMETFINRNFKTKFWWFPPK
jgi:hypothetical protein